MPTLGSAVCTELESFQSTEEEVTGDGPINAATRSLTRASGGSAPVPRAMATLLRETTGLWYKSYLGSREAQSATIVSHEGAREAEEEEDGAEEEAVEEVEGGG
eukprot:CAMPEP_0195578134 /NCGR_PEP_ID=MMETSP0814-20130614/11581_1 /TAXON_ID=97485 /ORGANISM="Prymnesium parvum, Strain Texoma1" /LENGTH=103 /DNA_ID=CAMNT_0040714623 /DNA_START=390 /DNA_END=698 /DNA_ORIENTATION=+